MKLRKIWIHVNVEDEVIHVNGLDENDRYVELGEGVHLAIFNAKVSRIGVCPIESSMTNTVDITIEFSEAIPIENVKLSKTIEDAWKTLK